MLKYCSKIIKHTKHTDLVDTPQIVTNPLRI
jgi:hypothetical protein